MAANPSIQLGTNGNWAIKEDNLLAYKKDGTRFFNKEFDFTRGTFATFVDKDGLIKISGVTDTELITNGDFATDSNWSKGTGWSIANGKASCNGSFSSLIQFGVYSNPYNKSFVATINVSNYTSGYFSVGIGGYNFFGRVESNGEHKIYFNVTNSQSNDRFYINGQGFNGSIDNISVKEIQTDVPRIDFTDDATGHLLLEPQSTNLYAYSEDFSQSVWNKLNCNVTLTSEVAPNGNANSVYNLTGTSANLYTSGSANIEHTISFYIKSNNQGKDSFKLRLGNNTSVEYTATNEWVRYEFTSTPTTSVFGITTTSAPNNEFDLLIWGAQSEALSYATSYIPTFGSTATRNADACNNSGSAQDFNSEEGVLYAEIAALADDGTNRGISLSDGSVNNRVSLLFGTSSNRIRAIVKSNNSTSFDEEYEVTSTLNYHKCAIKFKENDFALWIDSVERFTDTSGSTPIGLNKLMFSIGSSTLLPFYGKTKNVQVFKRAMSDGELYLLTVAQYQSYQEMATALNYTL